MVKGLYTAFTGMIQEQRRLDVLSNNLANATTIGYKKEGATSVAFADEFGASYQGYVRCNDAAALR